MKKKLRILLKIFLIMVCGAGFLYLMQKDAKHFQKTRLQQPKGELITAEEVIGLMQLFADNLQDTEEIRQALQNQLYEMTQTYGGREQENFRYKDYIELYRLLTAEEEPDLKNGYRDEFFLLKEDWYDSYDKFLKDYGLQDTIIQTEFFALSGGQDVRDEAEGAVLNKNELLSADGKVYRCLFGAPADYAFSCMEVYLYEDGLAAVKKRKMERFTLENILVLESDENKIRFFSGGYEIVCYQTEKIFFHKISVETIADLTFCNGVLIQGKEKEDRIGGRLLRFDDKTLEIQGRGSCRFQENCRIYRLYEELLETDKNALSVGYDFADYVLDGDEVCAILIMRRENMENIRVAVRSSGFTSLYHDRITLFADCSMQMIYGPYANRKTKWLKKGEKISFDAESRYLKGDRVELLPSLQSGRLHVLSVVRTQNEKAGENLSQKAVSYRGKMEIEKEEEGLVLINELLLEEYLYSVVPSEMPASYPAQALKAQAVCARTYAYRYLSHPGLPEFGAHVDDSVSFQVYNNIEEENNSTRAVKETTGVLLCHKGQPVSTYYYSTSCGFGTDAGIWNGKEEETPYLSSRHIAKEDSDSKWTAADMQKEDVFREYILNAWEEDYEREEAWYRWQYETVIPDAKIMAERMQESFHEIYDIRVEKRREGGIADVLLVETDAGSFEVTGEYNIRYVLNNGGMITRQDKSRVETGKILPSAYFVIDIVKDEGNVVGYTMFGGGFGHGVGMSQNGARNMGEDKMGWEEILAFFYPDCDLKKVY